ncbi:C-type lectin receptor-like tyrosine-protein kinase At1g52310 isoform X2 [Impatiens glandulifera]|uniref:C-type lectin receptor-like tyrosine-protein kinase At1g52310 isoform X2 n=1 Tax=Impatiens glandulifera TaxID=253017 RepID=UPI001FB090A4|nr:C-type lectin receptor-like tyrosine-protein kinase At1g52310 isoform X2 [Impatiens glandulifera]
MKSNFIFFSFHLLFLFACHLLQQGASSSVFKNSSDVQLEKEGSTKGVCPSGWVLNPSKKKCFGYFPSSLSWDDSESICKENYGHLAAVTSFEELNLVKNLCHDAVTNGCWVGGRVVNGTTVGSNGWKWSDNTTQWWNQSNVTLYNVHPNSSLCTLVSNNVTMMMLIAEQCNASHPLLCMRDLENKCHYGIQCHQEYLIILAVVSGLILCTTLAVVVWLLVYRRSKRRKRSRKLCNPAASAALVTSSPSWKVFTSEELKSITKNFSEGNRLVGDAKTGGTYSGVLPDGSKVAVKRLKRSGFQRKKDFLSEVGRVGRLQHENLVAVKGCCYDHGDRYLVYEFIANGPLDRWLHHFPKGGGGGGGRSLDWTVRMKIATTLAQGIAFLHDNVKPQVVHRDIRASNVLLDEEFGAHVMGVGLAKFVRWEVMQERISVMAGGTYGYLAPEYVYRNELTTKSDVYSFGVLLLEIISGRRPAQAVDSVGGQQQQQSIFEWATPLVHSHRYLDLLDPLIISSSSPSQKDHLPQPGLIQKLVDLVYACTQNVPSMRPRMSHVVHQLQQLLLSSN